MKLSDLNPPIGHPGGPCYVVKRIQEHVRDPHLRDLLIKEVEEGDSLSNNDAAKVYGLDVEPGVGKVRQIVMGPHASYRADLRGVNVPVIRAAIQQYLKQLNDWKSRQDRRYDQHAKLFEQGEAVDYLDPRTGLVVVFKIVEAQAKIVTTYWKGEPDPKAPSQGCYVTAALTPEEESGWKTFGKPPGDSHEPDSALPSPPNSRSKPTGKPYFMTPPSSDEAPEGKSLHKDRVRTLGVPGGDDHPWVDNSNFSGGYHQVRPDITASLDTVAAMTGPQYPGTHKQKDQLAKAKMYYQKRYRMQKSKIKQRAKHWYSRYHNDSRLKADRKRREEHPDSYSRKPGGGYHNPKDRSQDYRDKQEKHAGLEFVPVRFWLQMTNQWGWFLGADPAFGSVEVELDVGGHKDLSMDQFFDEAVFESDEDIEQVFAYLDDLYDDHDPMSVTAEEMGVLVRRQEDGVTPPDQRFNRGDELESTWPNKTPAEDFDAYRKEPMDNPGPGRMIPNDKDYVNKEASKISEILDSCSSDIHSKSRGIQIKLRRVDPANLMWLFDVVGSKGEIYKVRVKAVPQGKNIRDVNKTDVMVSCSCPYWRWQGPEHHAQQKGYLLGRPVGLATRPDIKDPQGQHGACKHVLACLKRVSTFVLPEFKKGKTASLQLLADLFSFGRVTVEEEPTVTRVASRYLSRVVK